MNITANLIILLLIPLATWWFDRTGNRAIPANVQPEQYNTNNEILRPWQPSLLTVMGSLLLTGFVAMIWVHDDHCAIGLNEINLILFSMVLIALPGAAQLSEAAAKAVGSTTGIIIQFPLYAGIMGIMKYSGLLEVMTGWFVSVANAQTFCIFSLFSAGLVNLFVPSGGGQWAVQGPLIIDAATQLSVAHPKAVMALAYGDQLTNMLQPFWALPLLGITGLKAGEIVRYSARFMLIGLLAYGIVLIFL